MAAHIFQFVGEEGAHGGKLSRVGRLEHSCDIDPAGTNGLIDKRDASLMSSLDAGASRLAHLRSDFRERGIDRLVEVGEVPGLKIAGRRLQLRRDVRLRFFQKALYVIKRGAMETGIGFELPPPFGPEGLEIPVPVSATSTRIYSPGGITE